MKRCQRSGNSFFSDCFRSLRFGLPIARKPINKELEKLNAHLRDDAKSFRSPFSSGLKKSTIRKTSEANDAEHLSELFAKQNEALLNNFKQTKKREANLTGASSWRMS